MQTTMVVIEREWNGTDVAKYKAEENGNEADLSFEKQPSLLEAGREAMAAPLPLLPPPTSQHSASSHSAPLPHHLLRSHWIPDLLQGLDLSLHDHRQLFSPPSPPAPSSTSINFSSASPLLLASFNRLSPSTGHIRSLAAAATEVPASMPLPGLASAQLLSFLSPTQQQQQQQQQQWHQPQAMMESLSRWDVSSGSSVFVPDQLSALMPPASTKGNLQMDLYSSCHLLGREEGNGGEESDMLNPCSPSRWEDALSAASHWPSHLAAADGGGIECASLVGSTAAELQLDDFYLQQWPLLELQGTEEGYGACSGVMPSAPEIKGSGQGCGKGAGYLSEQLSSLEAFAAMRSPVTVLEPCLLESHSRSQSLADFSDLCGTGNSVEGSGDRTSVEIGTDYNCHSPKPSLHSQEEGFPTQLDASERNNALENGSSNENECFATKASGSKRSLGAAGRVAEEEPASFVNPSTPVTKKRRRSSQQPATVVSRNASRRGATSLLVPSFLHSCLGEECKKDASLTPSMPLPPATPSPDSRPCAAVKDRSAAAASEVLVGGEKGGVAASSSSQKITTQVLRAVAGVEAAAASFDVKPDVGSKRRRATSARSPGQAVVAKQPPAKKAKASQPAVRVEGEAGSGVGGAKGSCSSERESHVIAERRRRKSMNCMLSTLGSLLPADGVNPKPSDRLKIVAETITYIEGMHQTLKSLTHKKTELAVAQKLLKGTPYVFSAYKTKIYPTSTSGLPTSPDFSEGAAQFRDKEQGQEIAQPSFSPVFTLDMCGAEAFITLTCLKGSLQLFSRTLLLLESLGFRVLNAQKSTNSRTAYHMIHITDGKEMRIKKEDLQGALKSLISNTPSL